MAGKKRNNKIIVVFVEITRILAFKAPDWQQECDYLRKAFLNEAVEKKK